MLPAFHQFSNNCKLFQSTKLSKLKLHKQAAIEHQMLQKCMALSKVECFREYKQISLAQSLMQYCEVVSQQIYMKQVLLFIVALGLSILVTCNQPRHLSDQNSDTSAASICAKAISKGCDYQKFKNNVSKCYKESESAQIKNQRQLKYCYNCLWKKANNLDSGYELQEHAVDDCLTQQQMNDAMGLKTLNHTQEGQKKVSATFDQKLLSLTIPSSLNYSQLMTSVKDQGYCGSCWTFAATAAYQAALKMNGFSYDLSVEATLECTSYYSINARQDDCGGGYFTDALFYYAQVGGLLDSKYPYTAGYYSSGHPYTPGICNDSNRIFLGTGQVNIYQNMTTAQIKALLINYGPMMVGVYADYGFMSYYSGTYSGCPSYSQYYLNHAVLLYGWDANGNWLIKNQWKTSWGNQGYMTLSSVSDCGLSSLIGVVYVPHVNSNPQVVMDPESAKTSKGAANPTYNLNPAIPDPSSIPNPSPSPTMLFGFYENTYFCWIVIMVLILRAE